MQQQGKGAGKDNSPKILSQFNDLVNMNPEELQQWLSTNEAQQVAYKEASSDESVGHVAGQRIMEIIQKDREELDESDFAHMERTINFIKRHFDQRPAGDLTQTEWRYRLMNWGHDPIKK
jgi:predicted Co/Zn/Cd cation transporter (cation efflux family)